MPCSYGFRPNRRTHDAIAEIHHLASEPINYEWVVEADIAPVSTRSGTPFSRGCGQDQGQARGRTGEGVPESRDPHGARGSGRDTPGPQGGPLSPLLANIALSALDEHFDRQWQEQMGTGYRRTKRRKNGLGNWRLIRYADDFVVMVHGEGITPRRCVRKWRPCCTLGAAAVAGKTQVVHIDEADFLGQNIRRQRKGDVEVLRLPDRPRKPSRRSRTR